MTWRVDVTTKLNPKRTDWGEWTGEFDTKAEALRHMKRFADPYYRKFKFGLFKYGKVGKFHWTLDKVLTRKMIEGV